MLLIVSALSGFLVLYFQEGAVLAGGNIVHYRNIHPYLVLTFASYIFLSIYYRSCPYFIFHKESKAFLKIFLAASLIGMVCWIALMRYLGVWGIYAGFLIMMVLRSTGIYLYYLRRWKPKIALLDLPLGLSLLGSGYILSILVPNLFVRAILYGILLILVCVLFCLRYFGVISKYLNMDASKSCELIKMESCQLWAVIMIWLIFSMRWLY